MAGASCRLLIVDDHKMVRQGLRALLGDCSDFVVVGEAEDGAEALTRARQLRPDVILMDLRMPGVDGLQATANIRRELPEVKIVVLTVHGDDSELVFRALKAGAVGYVPKIGDIEEVMRAIRAVVQGQAFVAPPSLTSLVKLIVKTSETPPTNGKEQASEQLSAREREILELVAQGHSNREIAERLYVSESTVRSHLHNILSKLQLQNRVQAAAYVLRTQRTAGDKAG